MAAARLNDLCDRLKMDEKGKEKVWTIFEHTLRTETNLYAGRHLDQNLLCIVSVTFSPFLLVVCKHLTRKDARVVTYLSTSPPPLENMPLREKMRLNTMKNRLGTAHFG